LVQVCLHLEPLNLVPVKIYESTRISEENLRQVQGDPPPRRSAGHLPKSKTQATSGIGEIWHVLQA
jgi:hypothetical protein